MSSNAQKTAGCGFARKLCYAGSTTHPQAELILPRQVSGMQSAQAHVVLIGFAGNNPWPIGVTSIGIHERSSREKISHVMNGAAHIMNDEATRKYLQAVKRLQTFLQRAYPTDPSRSVDFDGFRNAGLGAKGGGSDKAVSTVTCLI